MSRILPRRRKLPGAPPGTVVYTGPERGEPVSVHIMEYDRESCRERSFGDTPDLPDPSLRAGVTWTDVDGTSDTGLLERIGSTFGLHPLVLEDLAHTGQRPKLEHYAGYLFLILRMLTMGNGGSKVQSEQVGIILRDGHVLSFQERPGDVWDPVRERIRKDGSRIREMGPDYLAYALVDSVVDHYFLILEALADRAEELEEEVLDSPGRETLARIHDLRQELLIVRRATWPLRDVLGALLRAESPLISAESSVFFRDVHDHAVQVIDACETLRETVTGLLDLYVSIVGNRSNEVMKVLTIMASVFIPLTFLAGIYGMNFEFMPELHLRWAYPALLGLMATLALGLLALFKRKGWF